MAKKEDWFKDAEYIYTSQAGMRITPIVFKVPNAAAGPLEWTDWLYKLDDSGAVIETNMTAHILQCAIDDARDKQL